MPKAAAVYNHVRGREPRCATYLPLSSGLVLVKRRELPSYGVVVTRLDGHLVILFREKVWCLRDSLQMGKVFLGQDQNEGHRGDQGQFDLKKCTQAMHQ